MSGLAMTRLVCMGCLVGASLSTGCLRFGLDDLTVTRDDVVHDGGQDDADTDRHVDADSSRNGDADDADDLEADIDPDSPDSEADSTTEPQDWILEIGADRDDGELDASGHFGVDGYAIQGERNCWTYMGGYDRAEYPGTGETVSFFRFALPGLIPAGSTIDKAYLQLFGTDEWSWQPSAHSLTIFVELSADAPVASTIEDIPRSPDQGRPVAPTSIPWGIAGGQPLHWSIHGWNESPDISPAIQEVVDDASGLAAGAHVQLFLFRVDPLDDGEVATEDFCSDADNHARLVMTWTPP